VGIVGRCAQISRRFQSQLSRAQQDLVFLHYSPNEISWLTKASDADRRRRLFALLYNQKIADEVVERIDQMIKAA
jgi:uncharacterized protein YdaL